MLKSLITYITCISCLLLHIILQSAHINANLRETMACEIAVTVNKAGIILYSKLNRDMQLNKVLTFPGILFSVE